MKMFTKLALVSSMAISANAMAMQSMDDAALSAATGQDGINIGIGISKIEIEKVLIHDNDGLQYGY
jgi:CO dehydrogenase/acetyl-CoA synthase beta subunit